MDFEMGEYKDTTQVSDQEIRWDFIVKNGQLKCIDHNESDFQRAVVATFLQRGTIPQAPSLGIQWAECLTGDIQPQAINAQIRNSIINLTGELKYLPKYSMKDGKLLVEVKKI